MEYDLIFLFLFFWFLNIKKLFVNNQTVENIYKFSKISNYITNGCLDICGIDNENKQLSR